MALSLYRMVHASISDWSINHIPLNMGLSFSLKEA